MIMTLSDIFHIIDDLYACVITHRYKNKRIGLVTDNPNSFYVSVSSYLEVVFTQECHDFWTICFQNGDGIMLPENTVSIIEERQIKELRFVLDCLSNSPQRTINKIRRYLQE